MDAPAEAPGAPEAAAARRNFLWITVWFSLGHGTVTAPLVYASSLLDPHAAYLGNALLYSLNVISALLVAVPAVNAVGLKRSLQVGMSLYAIYVGCFAWSLFFAGRSAPAQAAFFCAGSVLGGIAAGLLWTVQGGFLARSASRVARGEGLAREELSGELAALFASHYLAFEFGAKCVFSLLQYAGMPDFRIGLLYFSVSVLSAAMVSRSSDLPVELGDPCSKVLATARLWRKPTIWLLAPLNVTFGCSAAYMNGIFNELYATPQLGAASIGLLSALTVLCAAVLARALHAMTGCCGKGGILTAGAASLLLIPLAALLSGGFRHWGWWLALPFALQGCGRAVYESTNKAIFSDFFRGEETEGAFANCSIQMSVASAVCFFASGRGVGGPHEGVLVALAAATPLAFYGATLLRGPEDAAEQKPFA